MAVGTIAVLVPTRDRAALAITAVQSVLESRDLRIRVTISDNSTDAAESDKLRAFVANTNDARLSLMRPPDSLSMPKHWNWAVEQVLADASVTHALVLTDRMMFKRGELDPVLRVVDAYPNDIVMYADDKVVDDDEPVQVVRVRWRGVVARVESRRLLEMTSQGQLFPVPRMMNSVTPRAVLEKVRGRFGSIFGSASPDFAIAYRSLAVMDTVLYYDRAPVFHYALRVSNGFAFARGASNAASADYLASLGESPTAFAPVPELITPNNGVYSEYCRVQQEVGSDKFPPVDRERYLRVLAGDIANIRAADLRARMENALALHGSAARTPSLMYFVRRLLALGSARPLRPMWGAIARRWNVNPPGDAPITFTNRDDAVRFMRTTPRRRHATALHLRLLFGSYKRLGVY